MTEQANIIIPEFKGFRKIPRLSRDIIITEKLDGSNGVIYIDENNNLFAGSKNKWLDEHNDNFGFWHWVMNNKEALLKLGIGYHYGEWMGKEIQRNYGLSERRFYLFNTGRWVKYRTQILKKKQEYCPECCYVVPILYEGIFSEEMIDNALMILNEYGSQAVKEFIEAEGIIIYHIAGDLYFKKTIENDEKGKNEQNKIHS